MSWARDQGTSQALQEGKTEGKSKWAKDQNTLTKEKVKNAKPKGGKGKINIGLRFRLKDLDSEAYERFRQQREG